MVTSGQPKGLMALRIAAQGNSRAGGAGLGEGPDVFAVDQVDAG